MQENTPSPLPPKDFRSRAWQPFLYALVMIIGMQMGFKLYENLKMRRPVSERVAAKGATEERVVEQVMGYINARYVDTARRREVLQEFLNSTLQHLDPHSRYISPEELSSVNEELEGNFEGIGIEFSIINDTIHITNTLENSPARQLGMQVGDKIVKVNDSLVFGKDLNSEQVVQMLKGKKGSSVKVSVARNGLGGLIDMNIVRDNISLESIDAAYMLNAQIGYIKIDHFSATTYKEFMSKMEQLQKEGMQQLVLDLRGNGGGYLDAATNILDELLGGRKIMLYTEGDHTDREEYMTSKEGIFEKQKIAVLIDQYSASASEIVAGALQDWDRGLIVGRRSFGKGLVQEQYDLADGGAMRLTVARYYTPSGRCIQKPYGNTPHEGAYEEELSNRILSGELFERDSIKFNDSLQYTTAAGKVIYGGGGIIPDVFVPLDTLYLNEIALSLQSIVPAFSYEYFAKHSNELKKYPTKEAFAHEYRPAPAVFKEYVQYVRKEFPMFREQDIYPYRTPLEKTLKAIFARQLWGGNGYYYVNNENDTAIQAVLKSLNP